MKSGTWMRFQVEEGQMLRSQGPNVAMGARWECEKGLQKIQRAKYLPRDGFEARNNEIGL